MRIFDISHRPAAQHEFTYRCTKSCPIGKHCFIIKVPEAIPEPMTVLYKCPEKKADIPIVIGGPSLTEIIT